MITNSDINGISNLHAMFLDLLKDQLTGYSSGDEQGWQKTDKFTKVVRPPSQRQTNHKRTNLLVITSYLFLNFLYISIWLDFLYFMVLWPMKINDYSNDQNYFVMKTFRLWFWLNWKIFYSWIQIYNLPDSIRLFRWFSVIDMTKIILWQQWWKNMSWERYH